MTGIVRWVLVIAVAAALAACSAGGSKGGSGGVGGSGGTGGTGGEDPLCGTKACGVGETCNRSRNPPRCECTTSPEDSCAAADPTLYCTATKVCKTGLPESEECDNPGEISPDGTLMCVGGFGADGSIKLWMKFCAEHSECGAIEFCDKVTFGTDRNRGLCYYNFCGDDQKKQDGTPRNGGNWGHCDADVLTPADPTAGTGQCVPLDGNDGPIFLCLPAGQVPAGGPCRFDSDARDDAACAAFTLCTSKILPATLCETAADCDPLQVCTANRCADKTCATDADCGGGYCYDNGESKVCRPFGTCAELCNAGTGPNPTCTSTEEVCLAALTNNVDFTDAQGYCTSPGCDMRGGDDECEAIDGKPAMCHYYTPVKGHPYMGICGEKPAEVREKGTACAGADVCEQGTLCIGSQATGKYFCRNLCDCPGADWDTTTGLCKTASARCADDESCAYFRGEMSLGACIPK